MARRPQKKQASLLTPRLLGGAGALLAVTLVAGVWLGSRSPKDEPASNVTPTSRTAMRQTTPPTVRAAVAQPRDRVESERERIRPTAVGAAPNDSKQGPTRRPPITRGNKRPAKNTKPQQPSSAFRDPDVS